MLDEQTLLLKDAVHIVRENLDLPDVYVEHIETLASHVAKLCQSNDDLPFYTLHNFSHNVRVLEILCHLLKIATSASEHKLSTKEKYLLVVAGLFHDIGMLDLQDIPGVKNPEQIRADHHKRSAEWVLKNTRLLGLDSSEVSVVAFMIFYHRKAEPLHSCPDIFLVGSEQIRTRLLAAYLRLADALHRDQSRAPEKELSFYRMAGMPTDAKFHWIKARAVRGIYINKERRIIEVMIGIPEKSKEDFRPLQEFVKQEIEDELESVRPTLASAGQPVYLGVDCKCEAVCGLSENSEAGREILELNNIISIDVSPNARKFAAVVVDCIKQLACFGADNEKEVLKCLKSLQEYAKDMVGKVVARRCHVAVGRLFVNLIRLLKDQEPSTNANLDTLLEKSLNKPYSDSGLKSELGSIIGAIKFDEPTDDSTSRRDKLDAIRDYFTKSRKELDEIQDKLIEMAGQLGKRNILKPNDRILLYGNSQSVIDMLCGYGKVENDSHQKLEILVAECRPKAKFTSANKIEYNDGLEYAEKLRREKFQNVAIIPDAAMAHVFYESEDSGMTEEREEPTWMFSTKAVTKVFLGFNGLDIDQEYMIHSCGHLATVVMAKATETRGSVKIYLVGTSNKCGRNVTYRHFLRRNAGNWLIIPSDRKLLSKNNLYNPVEDAVKCELFDGIISDVGIFTGKGWKNSFIKKIKENKNK